MKVIFVSNYFNHHQKAFCEVMFERLRNEYKFISTIPMREERKRLGYKEEFPQYVIPAYLSKENEKKAKKLILDADIVIVGSAPEKYIVKRILRGKVVFRYTEHIFKKKYKIREYFLNYIKLHIKNPKNRSIYLLCASAYAAGEFQKLGLFKTNTYKWGYFPNNVIYDNIDEILSKKQKNTILWCGRFLKWKRPEYAIEVAKRLKYEGYEFQIQFIGCGEEEDRIRKLIYQYKLERNVYLLGAMSPEHVRRHMEKAGIFLFTSNHEEGWGVVLNEAMNSGCAVVASHEIGSVPFLINDGKNGYIYESNNLEQLFQKVTFLLDNSNIQGEIGKEAYRTIVNTWNAEVAAERFLSLAHKIVCNDELESYSEGPCSVAKKL